MYLAALDIFVRSYGSQTLFTESFKFLLAIIMLNYYIINPYNI